MSRSLLLVSVLFGLLSLGLCGCPSCTADCPTPHTSATCDTDNNGQWVVDLSRNVSISELNIVQCPMGVFGNLVGNSSQKLTLTSCAYIYVQGTFDPQNAILAVDMQDQLVDFTTTYDLMSYDRSASSFIGFSVLNVVYPTGGGSPNFRQTGATIRLNFVCNASANCPSVPSPSPMPTPTPRPTPTPVPTDIPSYLPSPPPLPPPPPPPPPPAGTCLTCNNGCPKPTVNATCFEGQWRIWGKETRGYDPTQGPPYVNVSDFMAPISCPVLIEGNLVASRGVTLQMTRCGHFNITGIVMAENAVVVVDMKGYRVSPEEKIVLFDFFAYQTFFANFSMPFIVPPPGGVDADVILGPNQFALYFKCRPDVNCPAMPTYPPSPAVEEVPSPSQTDSAALLSSFAMPLVVAILRLF